MTHIIPKLIKLAKKHNVEFKKKGEGHYQLIGKFIVNYYPHSKGRTAYVSGTFKSIKNVTPEQVIQMCFEQPKSQGLHDKRHGNTRRKRAALHRKGINNCYWCKILLTLETSTLEHIIPLASNGLDNSNNRTLACKKCNSSRGHDMLELRPPLIQYDDLK